MAADRYMLVFSDGSSEWSSSSTKAYLALARARYDWLLGIRKSSPAYRIRVRLKSNLAA